MTERDNQSLQRFVCAACILVSVAVGAIVLAQGAVPDEIQSGTAAWVLSKPVSRTAFILAKLVALAAGVFTSLVGLQSLVAYGLMSLKASAQLPLGPFAAAVLGQALHTLFYLALTVLLGVWLDSRGAVLGGALGCLLGGSILAGFLPPVAAIPPWSMTGLLPALATGQMQPTTFVTGSMIAIAVLGVACVGLAIAKFRRIEF